MDTEGDALADNFASKLCNKNYSFGTPLIQIKKLKNKDTVNSVFPLMSEYRHIFCTCRTQFLKFKKLKN